MYSPRVEPDKIEKLYKHREMIKSTGEKTNMIKLVDEALARYIPVKEGEVRQKLDVQKEVSNG